MAFYMFKEGYSVIVIVLNKEVPETTKKQIYCNQSKRNYRIQ